MNEERVKKGREELLKNWYLSHKGLGIRRYQLEGCSTEKRYFKAILIKDLRKEKLIVKSKGYYALPTEHFIILKEKYVGEVK